MNHGNQDPQPYSFAPKSNAGKYGELANQAQIFDAFEDLVKKDDSGNVNMDFALVTRAAERYCRKFNLGHLTADDLIYLALRNLLDGKKKWYYQTHPHFSWSLIKIMWYTAREERKNAAVICGLTAATGVAIEEIAMSPSEETDEEKEETEGPVSSFACHWYQWGYRHVDFVLRNEILSLCQGDEIVRKIVAYCLDNPRESSRAGNMLMKPREICEALDLPDLDVRNAIKRMRRIYAQFSGSYCKAGERVH